MRSRPRPHTHTITCPACDDEIPIVITDQGYIGYPARGWDPGDPGEWPEWHWLHEPFAGCPNSLWTPELCDFSPLAARWAKPASKHVPTPLFDTFMEHAVYELVEAEREDASDDGDGYGPDPDDARDARFDRAWED